MGGGKSGRELAGRSLLKVGTAVVWKSVGNVGLFCWAGEGGGHCGTELELLGTRRQAMWNSSQRLTHPLVPVAKLQQAQVVGHQLLVPNVRLVAGGLADGSLSVRLLRQRSVRCHARLHMQMHASSRQPKDTSP